jgi:hypothetical protein
MSPEDRHTFDRWLKANAVVGFVLLAALISMALVGSNSAAPDEASVANGTKDFGVLTPVVRGSAVAGVHADGTPEPPYPGRYAANCNPGPLFGCVCETGSGRELSIFPQLTSAADASSRQTGDIEYLRMLEWLRRTCQALTESRNHH